MAKIKISRPFRDFFIEGIDQWTATLSRHGFNQIKFPIIIKEGKSIDVVWLLEDFASDPDLHYYKFENETRLIDSNGDYWSWKYNSDIKSNLPDKRIKTVSVLELRQIILDYFKNSKIENSVVEETEDATSIFELIDSIADKL